MRNTEEKKKDKNIDQMANDAKDKWHYRNLMKKECIRIARETVRFSVDTFLYTKAGAEFLDRSYHTFLPNGKICYCNPECACSYHHGAMDVMKFCNVTEKDLGYGVRMHMYKDGIERPIGWLKKYKVKI